MDFSQRSSRKELLDRDDLPFQDIERNMKELDVINSLLGGHGITINGIRALVGGHPEPPDGWLVCEIGCGGGDNIRAIDRWCQKQGIRMRFIGVDINADCIRVAGEKLQGIPLELIHADYQLVTFSGRKPHIIFSSLFCHHFTTAELTRMLHWMTLQAGRGFFINDLHRHPLAYYSIRLLTRLFSSSYLVKNDAPLSVLRGFTRTEWKILLRSAGVHAYSIRWKWAFRFLIIVEASNGKTV